MLKKLISLEALEKEGFTPFDENNGKAIQELLYDGYGICYDSVSGEVYVEEDYLVGRVVKI